jgi:uncharacterized protein
MNQPDADRQFEIQFTNGADELAGTVELPAVTGPYPAVVFIHGSGPADRGAFPSLSRYFVSRGFAVLNYDKPGVGGSRGNWLKQTFADRAREAAAAYRFLQNYPEVNGRAVGLCGGSQAGWVMPIAAQLVPDLAFIISLSAAAVTPAAQERYRLEWQMRADGFSEVDISAALAVYDRRLALIRQGVAAEAVAAEQEQGTGPGVVSLSGRFDAGGYWLLHGQSRFRPPAISAADCGALSGYLGRVGPDSAG